MHSEINAVVRIVHEEIKEEQPVIKAIALQQLHLWLESNPSLDFCKESIYPAIQEMNRSTRKKARDTLERIKDRIATQATVGMLRNEQQRKSADRMKAEILAAYELIERQGRGVVYCGSARTKPGDRFYEEGRELGREVYHLLGSTSWSGAGPGAMEAPVWAAKEAGGKVGGIKILLDGEESAFEQEVSPVFSDDEIVRCRYFGPRKVGLVDAGMLDQPQGKGAFIFFPGGFGTLDEFYELLTLKQLHKIGSTRDVPVLLMNYQGYYDLLLEFHQKILQAGSISPENLGLYEVCRTNREALEYLATEYDIPHEKQTYDARIA